MLSQNRAGMFFWGGSLMIKRVLAVDNDPFMLEFFRDVLPEDRCELFTAEDGLFALDLLDTVTPDIIFVDLVMPNIHGKKLCKIIRGMERLKDAYLVILSATVAKERIDVEALGVNACIAKGPIEHMARLVREVLEHPGAAALRCSAGEVIGGERNIPRIITNELLNTGGEETFDRLIEVNPEIKVLLSSGCGLDGEVSEVLKRGCSAFIQEPFNTNELSQKIRDVMTLN